MMPNLKNSNNIQGLIALLLCCFLFACQQKNEQPAVEDDKMAQIMADLYLAEAATNGLSGYSKDSLVKVYFDQVLQIHNISQETYQKELMLRSNDILELEQLHKRAQALLGEKEGEMK